MSEGAHLMNTPAVRTKELADLLAGVSTSPAPARGILVSDMTINSRDVMPGGAFIALPGLRTHGIGFAQQAVDAGASCVLWQPTRNVVVPRLAVPLIAVENLDAALGTIADRFFDEPSRAVITSAVTGTNGKTTTAYLIARAFAALGRQSGYLGTIGVGQVGALQPAAYTTPDCITVHREIAELRDQGGRYLGMEVSSHALDQHRVAGVRFDTAVFTNLTRDHLDYHGTFAAYGAAKAKLFTWPGLRHAVINTADAFGRELVALTSAQELTTYARSASVAARAHQRHLFAPDASLEPAGLSLIVDGSWGRFSVRTRLVGDFNIDNVLAVLAALLGSGVAIADAVKAVEACEPPPGRMQTIVRNGHPLAIVDYAHSPDALEKALYAARQHCRGKLFCVFGCGGDRDRGKRPMMGGIAARLADVVIITDDNPRTENGETIVADIVRGLPDANAATVQRDRALAIRSAIASACTNDVVLIAGKGHEDYQIVGTTRRYFSDRDVAQAALEART
jgi:UDP-N-acetylmuramoyl-L-alanyl-D-glutamate--2,6-diaminopimelate ligase